MDFKLTIAQLAAEAAGKAFPGADVGVDAVAGMLETPPDAAMGDYALPCFKLSKALRKSPMMISNALAGAISAPFLSRVESVKGYLNFFVDRATYAREVVGAALRAGARYGSSDEGAGKTIVIDYSSINIAKRFHIGHLSTTMIGNALYKMYTFLGYHCVGVNHLGDWGTQFGKMIAAYKRWGDRETVMKGGVDEMVKLYVRFNNEAKENPALDDEGRAWFKAIEDGNPEALEIFNWFKQVTLKDAERVYDMLGVRFDSYNGESFYADKVQPIIDELRQKGLLVEDQGAQIVRLDDYGMPPAIILRSDGATLYMTRDLAAAKYRHDTYHFDKNLYVVAYQQDLQFRQLFKVMELLGWDWAKGCEHVNFGMVSYEGQTLSTREGRIVARKIGIGAVVFFALYNSRIKDIDFWWDRALNFDGETGPYVMYTHARCMSVLRKCGDVDAAPDYSALDDPEAQAVVRLIDDFPGVVHLAVERNEPSLVTRFSVELAKAYNKFYYEHRILDDDLSARAARVELTRAASQTIKTALGLIGIEAPDRM